MDWNNKQMVLEAVKQNGWALEYASDELKNDREFVLEAVKQDGLALKYASDELKNDKEVVLEAVKQDGTALEYASDGLKNDKEVVLEAVKQNGRALEYAFDELKNDKDVLNSMRDFLMSDEWVGSFSEDFLFKAKENLLQYDAQDKREKELLTRLVELEKLQAQQNSNQAKVEVRIKRKL